MPYLSTMVELAWSKNDEEIMALDWRFDQKTAGLSFLAIGAYQSSRSASLPSLYETTEDNDSSVRAMRVAQAKSLVDGLVIGFGASFVSESLWPIAAVLAMVTIDACFYQWAMLQGSSLTVEVDV